MKKRLRLIRMLLIGGVFCTSGQHYYAAATSSVETSITQQSGKITGNL